MRKSWHSRSTLANSISCSDQHQNDVPGVNGRCEKHGRLGFDLRGQGKGSTLASSISCSDKDQNDIPGVNVRCKICGSLRFDLRGQGQGLCQRRAQQRSCYLKIKEVISVSGTQWQPMDEPQRTLSYSSTTASELIFGFTCSCSTLFCLLPPSFIAFLCRPIYCNR